MQPGESRAVGSPRGRHAVSEVIGTLVLVAVVMIGIAIVGLFLFASPPPAKVPVLDTIISNRSNAIYILHKGGDPLWKGQYKILVDGGDQTANFTIQGTGTEPWSVGETLTGISPTMPGRVVLIFNQTGTGGNAGVLASQNLIGSLNLSMDPGQSWYSHPALGSNTWHYRKKITIDHTQVAADQSSFPVLVSLMDGDLSAKAQSTGNDILFTSSDGITKLNHEIENYTAGTGSLTAWVEVPSLSSTTDTVLYLYYGNSTAPGQQNPTAVWSDANYAGVWHYDNGWTDSTQNHNNGTPSGTTNVTGEAAGAQGYGTTDYVEVAAAGSIADLFASPGGTLSAWINPVSVGGNNEGRILDKCSSNVCQATHTGWAFHLQTTNILKFRHGFPTAGGNWSTLPNSITMGSWQFVAVTYNRDTTDPPALYINGVPQTIVVNSVPSGAAPTDAARKMRIGAFAGGTGRYFNGVIDEARASKTIRSASWIRTEYNNQNSPSSFYTLGSEEWL